MMGTYSDAPTLPGTRHERHSRTHTPWRIGVLMTAQVKAAILAAMPGRMQYIKASLDALCERPRQRRLQVLPEVIAQLVETCGRHGVSDV
jgi:G:T/U-mismatch repair DNA glycosylase